MSNHKPQAPSPVVGVNGVRLKSFEAVVAKVLASGIRPNYVKLPASQAAEEGLPLTTVTPTRSVEDDSRKSADGADTRQAAVWPFSQLPPAARVRSTDDSCGDTTRSSFFEGESLRQRKKRQRKRQQQQQKDGNAQGRWQGLPPERALRKEQQIDSMIRCVFFLLEPMQSSNERLRIVDFGGGTGSLALPLALLFPHCDVVVVDLKKESLDMVHLRARRCSDTSVSANNTSVQSIKNETIHQSKRYGQEEENEMRNDQRVSTSADDGQTEPHLRGTTIDDGKTDVTVHENVIRRCQGVPNLYTFHGSIANYPAGERIDIGLALHVCGEATDVTLDTCGKRRARAFVVCSCCVGKIHRSKLDPYIYRATASNQATVSYPRSQALRGDDWAGLSCSLCSTQPIPEPKGEASAEEGNGEENLTSNAKSNAQLGDSHLGLVPLGDVVRVSERDFDFLARAADISDVHHMRSSRFATRRVAKSLVEWDRLLYMKEQYGFDHVLLTRMQPWEASPKNDILVGWKTGRTEDDASEEKDQKDTNLGAGHFDEQVDNQLFAAGVENDDDANVDIDVAYQYLVLGSASIENGENPASWKEVDWTREEEEEVFAMIRRDFAHGEKQSGDDENAAKWDSQSQRLVKRYPKGLGGRKRKLVHYAAQQLGFAHWCEGRRYGDKIVVVATKSGQAVAPERQRTPLE